MFKNQIQKVAVFAWNTIDDAPETGDAGNITGNVYIDGGGANAIDDTNPSELGSTGIYVFDLTAAETNGDLIVVEAASTTAGVYIEPIIAYTIFDPAADAVANVTLTGTCTTNSDLVTAAAVVTAIKAATGFTEGGSWTFQKLVKVFTAMVSGKWQDKSGEAGTYEVLDPEDATTVILEIIPLATTPQRTVSVQI